MTSGRYATERCRPRPCAASDAEARRRHFTALLAETRAEAAETAPTTSTPSAEADALIVAATR